MKKTLTKIWNLYGILSLVIHELSHIVVMLIVGCGVKKITIKKNKNLNFSCLIESKKRISKLKVFFVSFSPILFLLIISILSIFLNFFLILLMYELTNLTKGRTLPSDQDIFEYQLFDINNTIIVSND
jgi:hypothetical protein